MAELPVTAARAIPYRSSCRLVGRRLREELHHLVDQLPEAELRPALELIRGRVAEHGEQGRDLPFFASFEAEPDLAERAEEILSAELGR